MPCVKCKADFTLLTWKIRCIDCEQHHCSKCLRKMHGFRALFCEKCLILNKRPPDREKLMELRSKDLRDYLNKNHVSTHGLVEKAELVDLFYRRPIPVRNRRNCSRLTSVFSGSVPNLASQSQEQINSYAENAIHNLGRRVGPETTSAPRVSGFAQNQSYVSAQFPDGQGQQNYAYVYTQATSEPQNIYEQTPQPTSSSSHDTSTPQEAPKETSATASPHKYPKLSDFTAVEELSELSVKQLKELLTLNRVDYKGCVEKTELLDRATRLWNDSNQYKNEGMERAVVLDGDFEESAVDNLCKICMDAPLDCVILECGHMATCVDCGKRLAECPICRQYVTRVVRTFKA